MTHAIPDYIAAKSQPRSFGAALKMPQFTSRRANRCLTTALLGSRRAQDMPRALTVRRNRLRITSRGQGRTAYVDLACFSCHAINGRGGDMAPDLTWEGSSVQRPWLQAFLKIPARCAGADPPHAAVQPLDGDARNWPTTS